MSVQKCFKRTTGKPSTNGRKFKTLAWAEVLHMEVLTSHACSLAQKCPTLCNPTDFATRRLLCPWDYPGKNTGVGCYFLLQGIFLIQGLNLHLPCLLHWQVDFFFFFTTELPGKPTDLTSSKYKICAAHAISQQPLNSEQRVWVNTSEYLAFNFWF